MTTVSNSPNHVDRSELDIICRAIHQLKARVPRPFLFSVQGMVGSGVSYALNQLRNAGERELIKVIHIDLNEMADQPTEYNALSTSILHGIARQLDLPSEGLSTAWRGPGINAELSEQIGNALAVTDEPVIIIIDTQKTTTVALDAILNLEGIFFARLEGSASRQNVMIILGSKQRPSWRSSAERVRSVHLLPFGPEQTCQQLASTEADTERVLAATAGLAGANAWLYFRGESDLRRSPQDLFISEVYPGFVAPWLGRDKALADAAGATSLLKRGFDIDQFMLALQGVSYTRGLYNGQEKPRYFSLIDRMVNLGLVHYDNDAGQFVMEAHIMALLNLWNKYAESANYQSNVTLVEQIYSGEQRLNDPPADRTYASRNRYKAGQVGTDNTSGAGGGNMVSVLPGSSSEAVAYDSSGARKNTLEVSVQPATRYNFELQALFDDMIKAKASPYFIGRELALSEIAWHLCRQPLYKGKREVEQRLYRLALDNREVDIVFLTAKPGSGKTFLLRRILKLVSEASTRVPNSGVLVPAVEHMADPMRFGSPIIPEKPWLRDFVAGKYQESNFTPVRGLIDLELSSTSRLQSVRRAIRDAIVATIGSEELTRETCEAENLNFNDEPRPTIASLFKEYDELETTWEKLGYEAWQQESAENRRGWVSKKQSKIQETNTEVKLAFLTACRKAARCARHGRGYSRILLAFDTFDYPIRSSLSATQIISEIAAGLAGDYFFLVACRPTIEVEIHDPHLRNDLLRYLPDDLREQATVINLDDNDHKLTREEIGQYFEDRSWYTAVDDDHKIAFRGQENITKQQLVSQMSEVVAQRGNLPVLLSLLEFYIGINKGELPENLANHPSELLGRISGPEEGIVPRSMEIQYKQIDEDNFRRNIVDALLRNAPGAGGGPSEARQWALLLMSVLDRGLSWTLLSAIYPKLSTVYRCPSINDIWDAVLSLANANLSLQEDEEREIGTDSQAHIHLTLVKVVRNSVGKEAYKLHDYVGMLFNHYISWRLTLLAPGEEDSQFSLITKRESLIRAVVEVMHDVAQLYKPDQYLGPQYQLLEDSTSDEKTETWLDIYRISRSNQVYYSLRLAAVQHDDMVKGRTQSKATEQRPLYMELVKPPRITRARGLIRELESCHRAPHTTAVILSYLFYTVYRELNEYMAYSFTDMLLQEVRYYVYDQGVDPTGSASNLTLPIITRKDSNEKSFSPATTLYYAAILVWELANLQFPSADPWLEETFDAKLDLRTWRSEDEWQRILDYLESPVQPKTCQEFHIEWLDTNGFIERAHDACAVLLLQTAANTDHWARLRTRQARCAIANPLNDASQGIAFRTSSGRRLNERKGLDAAESYLIEVLKAKDELSDSAVGEVHNTYGRLCRIHERLDWELSFEAKGSRATADYAQWGALQHFYKALELQKSALEQDGFRLGSVDDSIRHRLEYANSVNNYAHALIFTGELRKARELCDKAIRLLDGTRDEMDKSATQNIGANLDNAGSSIWIMNEQPLRVERNKRSISNTLGRTYYTRGEMWRYTAEVEENLELCTRHYLRAIDDYAKASKHFEVSNREWQALLSSTTALVKFSQARFAYIESQDQANVADMKAQVAEMQRATYSLFPNDKVDGYRRYARMLRQLRQLTGTEANVWPLLFWPRGSDIGNDVTYRYLDRLNNEARQEYLILQRGFNLASKIKHVRGQMICTSDAVALLARDLNSEIAREFFKSRQEELNPSKTRTKVTRYRWGRFEGTSYMAIGLAQLDEIKRKSESSTASTTKELESAASDLKKGFIHLQQRSRHDWSLLHEYVNCVTESGDLLDKHLAEIYGTLKQLPYGDDWPVRICSISDKVNARVLVD